MEDLIIAALYLCGILCCMALDMAERTYVSVHRRRPKIVSFACYVILGYGVIRCLYTYFLNR